MYNIKNISNTGSNFKIPYHTFLSYLLRSCIVLSNKYRVTNQKILILLIICVVFDVSSPVEQQ